MRYFYNWIPAAAIATLVILSVPWLGLIALVSVLAARAPLATDLISAGAHDGVLGQPVL